MDHERNTVVCFSGHRYYAAAPDDEARLAEAVEAAWADGYRVFISGMAPGFDLAAAEAVVRLREQMRLRSAGKCPGTGGDDVRLVAAVPFAGQPREYSQTDLVRYEALLAASDEVCTLAERYSHGCYYRRDDWMVERSGRIICWYDGGNGRGRLGLRKNASKSSSGTGYTVRRAVRAGLEVVNIFRSPDGTLF